MTAPRQDGVTSHPHPSAWRAGRALMRRDHTTACFWCGCDLTGPDAKPTVDHVLTRNERWLRRNSGQKVTGGKILACLECNETRGDTPFAEFKASRG